MTRDEILKLAREHGTGGWQTLDDMVRFGEAVAAAELFRMQTWQQWQSAPAATPQVRDATLPCMSESNIQREIMLALSKAGVTIWRQNVGTGWAGEVHRISSATTVRLQPGDVVIRNARPLHAGLCRGSSDLIGLQPVVVGPEHVGCTFGRFVAAEVKTKTGRVSADQRNFIDHVTSRGGLAGVVRSPADALGLIRFPGSAGQE